MRRSLLVYVVVVVLMALSALPVAAQSTVSVSGTVSAASSTGLTVLRHDHTSVFLTYTASTTFQKNGVLASAGNVLVGDRAEVKYDPGTSNALAVKAWTPRSRKITGMFDAASGSTFTIKLGRGRTVTFELDPAANVVKNGALSSLDQLTISDQVQVTFVAGSPNRAFTIRARSKPSHITGTVSSVGSGTLELSTRRGTMAFTVGSNAQIRKSGKTIGLQSVLPGDRADVEFVHNGSGWEALRILADDPDDREAKGTVASVDTVSNTITVNTSSGTRVFQVTSQTSIERDDVLISLGDLAVGDFVEVKYIVDSGNLIAVSIEVKVPKQKVPKQEVFGIVQTVDTSAMKLTVQVGGTPMEFCVDTSTEIKRGDRRISLGDLMVGDAVKVEYIITASCNLAREIEVERHHEDLEAEGQVTAKGVTDFTILAENGVSVTFRVDRGTVFEKDDHPASFGDLQVNDRVEVHYTENSGTLLATKVKVED